jgi:hypothetical protein
MLSCAVLTLSVATPSSIYRDAVVATTFNTSDHRNIFSMNSTGGHQSSGSTQDIPDLVTADTEIATDESCKPEHTVRRFNEIDSATPEIALKTLCIETYEVRLLRLHPTDNSANHVRCDLSIFQLTELPSFIAIQNARGYRALNLAIEIDNQALVISAALERFLRYLRTRVKEPTYVWVRYACVQELDPQEQKTYWTREFSDLMYARASQIFDMHEINSRLIDNGYFETVHDSRYAEWNKDWYGRPDKVVLPRVCPIRLGTQVRHEAPTVQYQYMPLDSVTSEIRVMCIMPAEDSAAPVVMHAAHCPIKCEVTYVALSCEYPPPQKKNLTFILYAC